MNKKAFDTLITYLRPVRSKDSYGQTVETFAAYQKAFVKIDSVSGDEASQSERMQNIGNISFTGHFISGVDTTWRVTGEDAIFNITNIEPIDRRRWMRVDITKINE